ncbi:hypothetical protein PCANC_05571 [Puccinia coronata f. sp. avenae]|uniref:Uncharacterized protein n=1 Tax=Puccinia coronata f. sp. avenae TaxID=200324 RepID=A0A2N5VJD5_9BASI|nr:hypothetical protein PCANC_15145 [Puccinia coronata f. sp. avenae]PLW50105.1 hypothetical protein PCASD_01872 [Puccinia coronata f. sp. avenae]PLW51784.1 hypothetical protein PCANC_05571 [Puccinia coronata f. sp. avenae]
MTGNNCEQQLQAPWLPDGYFVPSYTECIYKSSHEAARFEEQPGSTNNTLRTRQISKGQALQLVFRLLCIPKANLPP